MGDRLTVTAVVTGVSSPQSFTVYDADLPEQGLLVLGAGAARAPGLVTVTGTVALFAFTHFQDRYDLGDVLVYRRFESRKVLISDEVGSWAGPRAPAERHGRVTADPPWPGEHDIFVTSL